MSNPKISVIIPCYGVERYVENLYMDLTKQSFSDIEMIFINDGGGIYHVLFIDLRLKMCE